MATDGSDQEADTVIELPTEKTWIGSICGYFRDFLDTDFKKTRAPKRQILSRDKSGILTGISLLKYPELARDIWDLLATPFGADMMLELRVRRGKYRSRLSQNLLAVINRQVNAFDDARMLSIIDTVKARARNDKSRFEDDPERMADQTLSHIKSELLIAVINPLLGQLDTYFQNQNTESLETIYNLEEELGDLLVEPLSGSIGGAIASAIVDNNFSELDTLIEDVCQAQSIRSKFVSFFEGFATSDFYRDLSELRATMKLKDNFQIYIYVGSLKYGKAGYPIFYFPIDVSLSNSIYSIRIDPHILINKKAIDFGVGEVSRAISKPIAFSLDERIIYVGQNESMLHHIQDTLDEFTNALSMDGAIDLKAIRPQRLSRSDITVDNSLHFAAFDQSDESLLNDYEELLEKLISDGGVGEDFKNLVAGFMNENPVSLESFVDDFWIGTQLTDRLVYDSPVPLNEEQRKIIAALNASEGKYIAVEGPPGTGKSHTITAVVFDAILKGRNVLVLSDKKEALDVAEQKIRKTLRAVRLSDNFQDPILRLGKQGSTYAKILSTKTVDLMRQGLTVSKANAGALQQEITYKEKSLKDRISQTNSAATRIDLKRIIELQKDERRFEFLGDEADTLFRDENFREGIIAAKSLVDFFAREDTQALLSLGGFAPTKDGLEQFFAFQKKMVTAVSAISLGINAKKFGSFKIEDLSILGDVIEEYESAKKPLIGFLFSSDKVRRIARRLKDQFDYRGAESAHKDIQGLRSAEVDFRDAINQLKGVGIQSANYQNVAFFQLIQHKTLEENDLAEGAKAFQSLVSILEIDDEGVFEEFELDGADYSPLTVGGSPGTIERLSLLAAHLEAFDTIYQEFSSVPEIDYADELRSLEHLQTQRLANVLDARVVEFADTKKNKAAQIKTIIKKKQKFPKDLFEDLRDAFPVMIAGIRDYAEYVPLECEIFDLIIIDEASQVSIAQALPAFVRAKKVLVLGDRNQFSNVKTQNASKMLNQAYQARIIEQFKKEENPDIAQLNQIKMFDIKTSVLEFVERIANLKIMLRKHFRGYPELIGFSSKYFYGDSLQAVKIRGGSIDEVIEFIGLEDDGLFELQANTNQPEAEAILQRLKKLVQQDSPPDVCIITPFNEQQRLLFQLIQKQMDGPELVEKLRLRIFTFDTCQGEEGDLCMYSMVATPIRDRLNYIFSKDIAQSDDVEESLRLQRLNVGFSRAKEKIEIFHSKPISEMSGGIQTALLHFQKELEKGRLGPDVDDVDPNSPMELQVLNWLRALPLIDELSDRVEIDAQFELGAYLRQLDPRYTHPNYKVDFLVKVRGERETAQIIIEYDGFKEHFTDLDAVDSTNYESYMKTEDVERQKILEGYGYRFLRINRFTIGKDPVKTLDERLRRLLAKFDVEREPPKLIEQHKKMQQSLNNGEAKVCSRCDKIKPLESFYDASLKGGKGAHGRVCVDCKANDAKPSKSSRKTKQSRKTGTIGWVPPSGKAVYLNCPYSEKDECKRLGGRWDPLKKKWYVPAGQDLTPFSRWC